MKRTSNRIALAAAIVFGVLPALSYVINTVLVVREKKRMAPVIERMADNDIHVVELTGKKASAGMLYVQNAWQQLNEVRLNVMPGDVEVCGDTLSLRLTDRSDVYQGRIMLADLKWVVRNGVATELREH